MISSRDRQSIKATKEQMVALEEEVALLQAAATSPPNKEDTMAIKPSNAATAKFTYGGPFVTKVGASDGISKQAWLANDKAKETFRHEPRDVGHLLAAKDGIGADQAGFVLSNRRDSCTGRVEGEKVFAGVEGRLAVRARTHSFGNDGSKQDLLKKAVV